MISHKNRIPTGNMFCFVSIRSFLLGDDIQNSLPNSTRKSHRYAQT